MTKVLVIGGGMAGCIAGLFLSQKGYDVTLVEKSPDLGGGCKTFFHGGHPYTYGPRHFISRDESIFEFFNSYVPMRRIEHDHMNLTYVAKDGNFYTYPLHVSDLDLMPDKEQVLRELDQDKGDPSQAPNFEQYILRSIGPTLFGKVFETYSKKMWKIDSPAELDGFAWGLLRDIYPKGLKLKTGPRAAWTDHISAFPLSPNGYDEFFKKTTADCRVLLSTAIEDYDMENHRVKIDGQWHSFDIIVSSTYPEVLLNNAYGPLRWLGRDFFKIVLPVEQVFPEDVFFLYYAGDEQFTRIVEYKKFYRYKSPSSLIIMEIPSMNNKLYPCPMRKYQEIAEKYFAALPRNVFSIGRLGSYLYMDMDNIYTQCRELVEKLD